MFNPIGGREIPIDGIDPNDFGETEVAQLREELDNPLTTEMEQAIAHVSDNPRKQELIDRQHDILAQLPPDFLVDLKAHIQAAYVIEESYGNPVTPETEKQILRGAVFEMLVKYDREISPEENAISDELLALIGNPDRFRFLKDLGQHRNPDLAYIDVTESGQIIIKGVGEIKLGHLNARALSQLQRFQQTIILLREFFRKSAKELENHGLEQIAQRKRSLDPSFQGKLLELAADFQQVLIVPQNRSVEGYDLLEHWGQQDPKICAQFDQIRENLQIEKSAFSIQEIVELTKLIAQKIDEMNVIF